LVDVLVNVILCPAQMLVDETLKEALGGVLVAALMFISSR
jgi:hypothetical protein